ncbi:MATE family efflux transporter [Clostridioides difficile]|uniref:MATE family efflux transporter n=1 Tax=Clostridioides difficile TaxID=1496 RepID=UPI0013CE5F77|nr:MATE family efflux transporter [Clostridioides difficile]
MEEKYKEPLEYEKVSKLLTKYAIPSIIAMLVSALYNIVDQIFIGQGVGVLGNAATNVTFPLTTICTAIALLLGIGGASKCSLELGAKNSEKATKAAGNSICLMAVFGISLFIIVSIFLTPLLKFFGSTSEILPYAHTYTKITSIGLPFLIMSTGMSKLILADGRPKASMFCMLIGAVINTILNPLFIFVFNMGIAGSALATVIGQLISFGISVHYIKNFQHIKLHKKSFKLDSIIYKHIFALGSSSCFNQLAMTVTQIVMNNTLAYYGARSVYGSEIPLACVGIIIKVNMIFISIIIGISQGMQPIIGYNYGAEKYNRVKEAYKFAVGSATIISVIAFLCFQFFPRQITSIFGNGNETYFIFAEHYFRTFLFLTFINGVQIVSSTFFTSIGKSVLGLFTSLTRQILFLIPLIVILPMFMGIDGVMFAGPIADAAAAMVCIYLAVHEMKSLTIKQNNLMSNHNKIAEV